MPMVYEILTEKRMLLIGVIRICYYRVCTGATVTHIYSRNCVVYTIYYQGFFFQDFSQGGCEMMYGRIVGRQFTSMLMLGESGHPPPPTPQEFF